jgi:uncharacterized protein HemY
VHPRHIDARWALIELYLKLPGVVGGSESKAIRYSELMRLSPVDGNLSRVTLRNILKAKAEQYYKKAIAIRNSKVSYQNLADLYRNKMNDPARHQKLYCSIK